LTGCAAGAQLRRLLSEEFRSLEDFRAADRARHPVRPARRHLHP